MTVQARRDPDARGYFGEFGGRFVPETLVEPIEELERAYFAARDDDAFAAELERLLKQYVGRPTPVYPATRLTQAAGGAQIFLKREDLTHTGAHKINNALGQALLAARMGKRRIVAETGAGQHGVATATACALLGLECHVYMGAEDMDRQALNVFRMRLLGAEVLRVAAGSEDDPVGFPPTGAGDLLRRAIRLGQSAGDLVVGASQHVGDLVLGEPQHRAHALAHALHVRGPGRHRADLRAQPVGP